MKTETKPKVYSRNGIKVEDVYLVKNPGIRTVFHSDRKGNNWTEDVPNLSVIRVRRYVPKSQIGSLSPEKLAHALGKRLESIENLVPK